MSSKHKIYKRYHSANILFSPDKPDSIPLWIILLFAFIIILILFSGIFIYQLNKRSITIEKKSELNSIAELKVKQISDYRKERYSEANNIFNNESFILTVKSYLLNPGSNENLKRLNDWLIPILNNNNYEAISIIDAKSYTTAYFIGNFKSNMENEIIPVAVKSLNTGKIIFGDFFLHKTENIIHFEIFIPLILIYVGLTEKIAVVQFIIDPEKELFEIMQTWPSRSNTGEVLIVKKDGNDVLYLNELRFQKNTALKYRIPLSSIKLPAARGLRGERGVIEGIDYRGAKVISAIKEVPNSDWVLVAKIDKNEIYKGLKIRDTLILVIIFILLNAAILSFFIVWRGREANYYKSRIGDLDTIKRLNRIYMLLSKVNEAIVKTDNIENFLNEVCHIAIEDGGYNLCWIGILNKINGNIEPVASYGPAIKYIENLVVSSNENVPEGKGPTGIAFRQKKYFICNNIWDNPTMKPWREKAILFELRSSAAFPLINNSDCFGTINLYSNQAVFFSLDEINLLEELSNNISYALEKFENENQRKEAENALIESEELYRQLFEAESHAIFLIKNKTGNIIAANNAATVLYGYSKEELLNMKNTDLSGEPEQTKQVTIETPLEPDRIINIPLRYHRKKDGTIFPVEIFGRFFTWKRQSVHIASINDISERKLAEDNLLNNEILLKEQNDQLNSMNEEYMALNEELQESSERIQKINLELVAARIKAEESDRLKSAFLANMSHEIRTPMNAIVGFADLIQDSDITPEKRKQYSKVIVNRSNDLLKIINDILDISKIEAGSVTLNLEKISLNQLLDELFLIYNQKLEQLNTCNIKLLCKKSLSDGKVIISTDVLKLKQIFTNLLDNAIKFTEEGEISFGYTTENNTITCFVSDTGIGIDPVYHDKIFERFKQAVMNNNKLYGGSGLGLSICKGNAKLLGSDIWIESELGKGSNFFFKIPLLQNEERKTEQTKTPGRIQKNWKGKKILIIEDDEFNIDYIKELLTVKGTILLVARSGKEARAFYDSLSEIDLVLMDIRLTDANGYDLTKEMKALCKDLPIIAQTAYAMETDKIKCIEAGCADYIAKPIKQEQLIELVNTYIKQ